MEEVGLGLGPRGRIRLRGQKRGGQTRLAAFVGKGGEVGMGSP